MLLIQQQRQWNGYCYHHHFYIVVHIPWSSASPPGKTRLIKIPSSWWPSTLQPPQIFRPVRYITMPVTVRHNVPPLSLFKPAVHIYWSCSVYMHAVWLMCVCTCTCVCMCMCIHARTCEYVHVQMYVIVQVHACVGLYAFLSVCLSMWECVCGGGGVHVYTCTHMWMCACANVCDSAGACMCWFVCISVCVPIHVGECVCVCVGGGACMHACMSVCASYLFLT